MSLDKLDKRSVIKLVFLAFIFTIIVIVGIRIAPWLIENGKNPQYIREYLAGFGNAGFVVYVLIQAIHVIIVIIPGDIFNICGGFVYGIPLGFALSFLGMMVGTVIVFYISRFFGYEIVSKLIAKEKIDKMSGILNSTKGTVGMFIICCIPFIPKDLMMYIAGLTPVKASRLFLIYGLSRIPGTLIWVSIGANAYEKDIWGLGITIAIMLIMLVIVFFLGRYYNKKEKIPH
ncbi:MAG TPA: VTT domain-containing protein [Paludibacter sp.]